MGLIWSGRADGHKKIPGANPTRGVGARDGSHARSLPTPVHIFSAFFRPRPGPGCSYLEPAMERDRGAQRVNSFNHCCCARAWHSWEGTGLDLDRCVRKKSPQRPFFDPLAFSLDSSSTFSSPVAKQPARFDLPDGLGAKRGPRAEGWRFAIDQAQGHC